MSAGEKPGMSLPSRIPRAWTIAGLLLTAAGIAAFLAGVTASSPARAWQAYLVNYLFWTGLSSGAVLFVAILNMTGARWGRPLKRMAEALGAFLPVSFLLFWVLYIGREEIFPWIREPVPGKEAWLQSGFMFARNGVGLFLLTFLSSALVCYSVRGDRQWIAVAAESAARSSPPDPEGDRNWKAQCILSPLIGILYAFVLSLLSFDLVMSLDPHWYSTLFGAYFFMSSFYLALAAIGFLSLIALKTIGLQEQVYPWHFHDLGKLIFGFCVFTGYLFYTQFLVIWYGNLPEETGYIIMRTRSAPWETVAWAILAMTFAVPFLALLSRKIKMKPKPMTGITAVILAGMWLERFILVVPSLWAGGELPLGLTELLTTAGFLGIVVLCLTAFLRRVPLFPVSDPLFRKSLEDREAE